MSNYKTVTNVTKIVIWHFALLGSNIILGIFIPFFQLSKRFSTLAKTLWKNHKVRVYLNVQKLNKIKKW